MKRFFRNLSHVQIIALGFVILIAVGTALLMLPVSSANGQSPPLIDALFTATSASCVTGLVTLDTATFWSPFGQAVILFLIQLGGLGFMTIATLFFILFRKRMGLRQKEVMGESINSSGIGGVRRIAKKIVFGTLIFEGAGSLILSLLFHFRYGFSWGSAIWKGVFHAVSAFCNAGFDLNGQFQSFVPYRSDRLMLCTLMALIVIGGIGFFVWDEVQKHRFRFSRYSLHAKVVLTTTTVLLILPTLLFFIVEAEASHNGLTTGEAVLASFFDSITPRTAGMNVTDTSSLSTAGQLLTILLMFIGGSPSSTAGGIKTTTLVVLILFALTTIRKSRYTGAFGRRFRESSISKAVCVLFVNITLIVAGLFAICCIQPELAVPKVCFEVFSAIGTVGMSMGITQDLEMASQIVIILLMFTGRVGSISFGSALIEKKAPPPVIAPYEDITIG